MSLARRSLQIVAFVCTLIVGVASMAVIVTQTTWFKEWLRGFIVRQAEDYVNGRLSIGRLDGNLFFGVELDDVDVTVNGQPVVGVKQVGLNYNAFTFMNADVVLDHIRLDQPQLHLVQTTEGWNLANLIKARTPKEPSGRTIEIGEIGVSDGTLYVEATGTSGVDIPSKIDRLDASVGVKSNERELTVDVTHVSLRTEDPGFGLNALSGVVTRTQDEVVLQNVSLRTEESSIRLNGRIRNLKSGPAIVEVKASSDKLAVEEIAKLIPALRGYAVQPAFELTANGPTDRMAVDVNVRDKDIGNVIGDLTVDVADPGRRIAGTVSMQHFNVAPIAKSAEFKSDITGQARIDMALPSERLPLSGTYAVNADRVQIAGYDARDVVANGRIDGDAIRVNAKAAAYGGHVNTQGTITTGRPLALDLSGSATDIDLRNLPPALNVPRVPSTLQFEYTVSGRGQVFSGDVRLAASTVAGATLAPGTTGQFRIGDGAPSYASKGEVTNLDLEQIGRGFTISALAVDRFRSRINGTFDMKGSGGGRYPLALDASGTLVDSEMFGASFPRLDFTTNIAQGDIHAQTTGDFAHLNPAVVSGNEKVAGALAGHVDAKTTIHNYAAGVTVDSVDVTGRVDLTASTIADFDIASAVVDGQFANREGNLGELAIVGPDLNVTGHGPIALNDSGSSNLELHAESPSLERIGKIVGQPLTGGAIVDAVVNGNGQRLVVSGLMTGMNIGQGDNKALNMWTEFDVLVPELKTADATFHANSGATFLEVGGQKINEMAAYTTYSESKLYFSANAKQGLRMIDAGGEVVFHPDHQEIHLPALVLRSEQIEWRSAPGSQAAIQYGKDRVGVDNLQLVSGDQRITANGVFGSATESLKVHLDNLDVSQLDQLLLGDARLGGRFTADATLSGPKSAPEVAADFTLNQGAFQSFKFESFGGKVNYAESGVTLDVRLQQNATQWLTAVGHAPISLFRANPADAGREHVAATAGEAVDIQVASSPIDLGIVQGFTSYVTNVAGVVQANFKVTGSGFDPHLDGAIEIRQGAFALPELGTTYTGLDTRIELQPDAVKVAQMRITDNHDKVLTVGGELAVHERGVGGVDIAVKSDDFKVLDNKLGNLRLDTDIHVTGNLRKPRIEGSVDVSTGTINVADVLERATANAYATESTALPGADTVARPPGAASTTPNGAPDVNAPVPAIATVTEKPAPLLASADLQPTFFQTLDLRVKFAIPDDLVLKGQDIRTAGSAVSLGDMSVTVGGEVQVTKYPYDVLRLQGDITTVRGTYTFQGRRFEITRDGRIRFFGGDELDPYLDIQARRVIAGVETFVQVRGTTREPELSFRSNPPLEEADILSLIVFNQPINELGEGQQVSLSEQAAGLAGGYLASGLARSIGNALNLNEFEIQAQGTSGASVMIGQQVGKDLFFRVRQGFGNAQSTEFILEYQIADFLRLQGTIAETSGGAQRVNFRRVERGGLDLIFFFAY